MKKNIFLILALFTFTSIFGQAPGLDWVGTIPCDGGVYIKTHLVDDSGNIILVGSFSGTADFDFGSGTTNLTAINTQPTITDCFVAKYDNQHNLLSAKRFGGVGDDWVSDAILGPNGSIFILGSFGVNFQDPDANVNFTSAGETDCFILKLSSSGNFIFAKAIKGDQYEQPSKIRLDANLNIFVAGQFNGNVDFDPSSSSTYIVNQGFPTRIFILKLAALGDFDWVKTFESSSNSHQNCYSMTIDGSGSIYLTGNFSTELDFDPGPSQAIVTTANQNTHGYLVKLNNSGNLSWYKTFACNNFNSVNHIQINSTGNIYIGGRFNGTADLDPGLGTQYVDALGDVDSYIVKLTSTGSYIWSRQLAGPLGDYISSIYLDQNDNLFISGAFSAFLNFDAETNTLVSSGQTDGFLFKINTNGTKIWVIKLGNDGEDFLGSITLNDQNELYVSGQFQGEVDFDPTAGNYLVQSPNTSNSFLWKLNQNQLGIEEISHESNFQIHPNPSSGELIISWSKESDFIEIQISDTKGNLVKKESLQQNKNGIFSSHYHLENGLFFIRLKSKTGELTPAKKWIVQ